jgi:hypothetical protein
MKQEKDYKFIPGRGYVANIDGEEVVYDIDELPELLERISASKNKINKEKPTEDRLSFKEFLAKNIDKYPDLAYIFNK